jgi:hypothetical protein
MTFHTFSKTRKQVKQQQYAVVLPVVF